MNESVAQPQTSDAGDLSPVSRITNVFTSPSTTYHAIKARPDFIVPLIIITLISVVLTYFIMPIAIAEQQEVQIEKMMERGMTADEAQTQLDRFSGVGVSIGWVFGTLGPALGILVIALVLWFGGNVILGGKAGYGQMFSAVLYSNFIPTLGMLIKVPLMLSKETVQVSIGPGVLLSSEMSETFLYKFLMHFDLFVLWQIGVLSLGMGIIYSFTTQRAAYVVAGLWLIYAIVASALGSMF